MFKFLPFLLLPLLFLPGCKDDDTIDQDNQNNNTTLLRYDRVAEITPAIAANIAATNPDLFPEGIEATPATFYRVEYRTPDPAGNLITASGLVGIPGGVDSAPVGSVQAGTVLFPDRVPSLTDNLEDIDLAVLLFAGTGMISVQADYIGFGASDNRPHPYQHAATLGSSTFDLLRAARELAAELELSVRDELYLTGYSLGGDATMALHRHIEQNSDWTVTFSAPAGGAYDKVAIAEIFATGTEPVFLAPLYLWITQAYDDIYGLDRPWSFYVTPDNAALITGPINDGLTWINGGFSRRPNELLTGAFRSGVLDGTDRGYLSALEDNDLTNWSPRFPLTIYHGVADTDVPVIGARNAFTRLSAANPAIELVELEGADHQAAFNQSAPLILQRITELRQ